MSLTEPDALADQIDSRQAGDRAIGALSTTKLAKRWSAELSAPGSDGNVEASDLSYPLIAGGRSSPPLRIPPPTAPSWSPSMRAPDEQNAGVLVGTAIGSGELLVPAGNRLTPLAG